MNRSHQAWLVLPGLLTLAACGGPPPPQTTQVIVQPPPQVQVAPVVAPMPPPPPHAELVPPDDAPALARALGVALADAVEGSGRSAPEARKEATEYARGWSMDALAERYVDVYGRAIEAFRARRSG